MTSDLLECDLSTNDKEYVKTGCTNSVPECVNLKRVPEVVSVPCSYASLDSNNGEEYMFNNNKEQGGLSDCNEQEANTLQLQCKHGVFQSCKQCMSAYSMFRKHMSMFSGLKVAHINVRSLCSKIDEIQYLVTNSAVDIFCVCETWLDDTVTNSEVHIDGYTVLRKDRNRNGGGVAMYVKNGIDFQTRDDLTQYDIESVWIEVKISKNEPLLISTMYRPPSADRCYYNNMLDLLDKVTTENKELLLLGDLNFDYKIDESLSTNAVHYMENLYILKQLVDQPTRITNSSKTLLDVILSSIPEKHNVTGVARISLSDHFLVYTCLNYRVNRRNHKTVKYRDYKNFNEDSFLQDMFNCQIFSDYMRFENVDIGWSNWKSDFIKISDKHAPLRNVRVKERYNPWITSDIINLMYKRDYLHEKAAKEGDCNGNNHWWNEYKDARNQVTSEIVKAKKKYFDEISNNMQNNPKKMWRELSKITGKKQGECQIPSDITCDDFNKYFVNVGVKMSERFADKRNLVWKNPDSQYRFIFSEVTPKCVLDQLNAFDSSKSNIDILGIDSKLLKIASTIIEPSLTFLFNLSITTSCIPSDWKLARVTPIYKGKGSQSVKSNYRPISVIPHIAKILEKEVQSQLMKYFIQHDLISLDQFAFLKNHSTQTCLHRVIDDWLEAFNEHEVIGAAFLDIQKCFDSIDHELLHEKLQKYGVCEYELQWFKSYLSGRSQKVYCNNTLSAPLNLGTGVPQGSNLGPLLFLVFINDLSQHTFGGTCSLYADDVVLYTTGISCLEINKSLQETVSKANEWYFNNRLSINAQKSNIMFVRSKQSVHNETSKLHIQIDGQELDQVDCVRYLGVDVDCNLTWAKHVQSVCRRIAYKLSILGRLSKFINKILLNTIYMSHIQPIIDYACSIWGNCAQADKELILRLQKRAARIVSGNYDYINCRGMDILNSLNWQTLDDRRSYYLCTLMYKCIHGTAPQWLSNPILMACEAHDVHTRSAESLNVVIPKPRLEVFRNSFQYAGAKAWNDLPSFIKEAGTLETFKLLYKRQYFKRI